MITEDYVSFAVSKLLEEKGFDSVCNGYYNQEKVLERVSACSVKDTFKSPFYFDCVPAPTLQMAIKWLREIHNINIDIVSIWNKVQWEYQIIIITPKTAAKPYIHKTIYIKREQACEVAIKYCLENLI